MPRPTLEVADMFRHYGTVYREAHQLSCEQLLVMCAIEVCRTAALGGHVEKCDGRDFTRHAGDPCRNRHRPKCVHKAAKVVLPSMRNRSPLPFIRPRTIPPAPAFTTQPPSHVTGGLVHRPISFSLRREDWSASAGFFAAELKGSFSVTTTDEFRLQAYFTPTTVTYVIVST